MGKRILLIISCLVILIDFMVTTHAWSAEWVLFWTTSLSNMYYDKSSIKKNENIYGVWWKDVYNEEGKIKTESVLKRKSKIAYTVTLTEFDCVSDKFKLASMNIYDSSGNQMLSNTSSTNQNQHWTAIVPDTYVHTLKNLVCRDRKGSKLTIK